MRIVEFFSPLAYLFVTRKPPVIEQHVLTVDASRHLCPVSSIIDTRKSGYFSYPPSVIVPTRSLEEFDPNDIFNCSYTFDRSERKFNVDTKCVQTKDCPITAENVQYFIGAGSSRSRLKHSFCPMFDQLRNETGKAQTVNIVFLGDSPVMGRLAHGCCCRDDTRCPGGDLMKQCNASYQFATKNQGYDTHCRLSEYFSNWVRQHFPAATIQVITIAHGGFNSLQTSELVQSYLNSYGIRELTSSDIIITDHSVNDAAQYIHGDMSWETVQAVRLETLLRSLLHMSVGYGPAIVVMDTMSTMKTDHDYSGVNKRISYHYATDLWSFHDLANSHSAEISKYKNFLQYTVNDYILHPSWAVHLLWADLLASSFLVYKDYCQNESKLRNKRYIYLRKTTHNSEGKVVPVIPSPIKFGGNGTTDWTLARQRCTDQLPVMLDMDSEVLYRRRLSSGNNAATLNDVSKRHLRHLSRQTQLSQGRFATVPTGAWPLMEDRTNKFGWVAFGNTSFGSSVRFYSDSIALSPSINQNLSYTKKDFIVRISFLKTYYNAGQVSVNLCGHQIGSLDALWHPHIVGQMKKSVAELFLYKAPFNSLRACLVDNRKPLLEIKHEKSIDGRDKERTAEQKFRLISTKVCFT